MVLCSVVVIAQKVAEKCVDQIIGHIGTELGHLWNYSANLKKLQEEVGHLSDAKKRMEDRIEDAGNKSGETKVDAAAESWLKAMAGLSDEASTIIQEEDRETGRCLMGLRPNLMACYRASKSAKKVMESADQLKKDGDGITTVAHVDYSKALGFVISPDFAELESRKKASEEIMAHLKDPSVRVVGMYGMGGAGKTSLAEKIGVQLYLDETFRYVVKTDVCNNEKTDLIHIQKQIGDLLKINLGDDKDDVKARAKRLREQLEKKAKVLIILDDIWHKFELRSVGIPLEHDLKVLITSRDVNLMNEMDSEHNVPLDILSPEDSWKLFDKMANGIAPNSDRYSTARDVVKQCGGIPVLLVTIARTLRNKDLETWKEASLQLKKFEKDDFVDDGYKRLEVSYNFLNSELKSLFLLCAQVKDHRLILVDDLLKYTMGLGLFEKRTKLHEVRSRLYTRLGQLKSYCLLNDGNIEEGEETMRMHDIVHKFGVSIANRDRGISSTVEEGQLQKCPSNDKVQHFSISLPHRHLPAPDHQFPVVFDSSKLESFLFIRRDYLFLKVPDEFFKGMKELKLIHIRKISLSQVLLSSLNVLVNLKTLCLDHCEFDDIDVVGKLPMLQVLSLRGSTVSRISSLGSSLKLLDLRGCYQLKVISLGVLSNLTLLEDFRIGYSFHEWDSLHCPNSSSDNEISTTETQASLREFENLGNLINLDIKIGDPKKFPKDLVFKKLERFNIFIGCHYVGFRENLGSCLRVGAIELHKGIKELIAKTKYLYLEKIVGVTSLCEIVTKGFPTLMRLTIDAIEIQCIVRKRYNNCVVFPKLERLEMHSMSKLESICYDHLLLPEGSLQNLKTIEVSSCHVLKYLFSSQLALRGLLCLKKIKVRDCWSMESIVSSESENRITDLCNHLDDEEEEEIIEFSHLRKLRLIELGRFISFYPSPVISSSQERQEQDSMSTNQWLPTSLFNGRVVLPKLEKLLLVGMSVDQFATKDERMNYCWFQNLTILRVRECHNLNYLFTSSVVKSLVQLKELEVDGCDSIEEIVATEMTIEDEDDVHVSFPALVTLKLRDLPELKRICGGPNLLDCPNLANLQVCLCERLIDFHYFNIQKIEASLVKILTTASLEECGLVDRKIDVSYRSGNLVVKGGGSGCLVSTIAFLELFPELETVSIEDFCFDYLFPHELDVTPSIAKILAGTIHLQLSCLFEMKQIWSGQYADGRFGDVIPQNIKILEVDSCEMLIILAPKSALFHNLTRLIVWGCNELINLVSSTTAKSLVNLTEMTVGKCGSLIEIVAIYDDHDGEEDSSNGGCEDIVFGKLKKLMLFFLRSLTSFTTNNCNLQFPSLERVNVVQCPNMEFFCKGALTTPKLSKVWIAEERNVWEGDLDSTVRLLHKEMSKDKQIESE